MKAIDPNYIHNKGGEPCSQEILDFLKELDKEEVCQKNNKERNWTLTILKK